ncbi:MAG TPA: hypothetical protein PLU23_00965 [Anaerolineaceae bacterium]|nr:hypothetical protein [Anaerolineaceae bacterium]
MTDEKLRILKMVETGTITASQAAELLSSLPEEPTTEEPTIKEGSATQAKWIKILVTNRETGKNKVNLRIPLKLFPWKLMEKGLFINISDKVDQDGTAYKFDKELVMQMINNGEPGVIIDVDDEDSEEKVLITLE